MRLTQGLNEGVCKTCPFRIKTYARIVGSNEYQTILCRYPDNSAQVQSTTLRQTAIKILEADI